MNLTTITHISVDGVMQGLGGPDEDPRGGFERGGWALPLFHDEAATFLDGVFQRADAFLFGRRTYEIFAGSWGTGSWGADQGNNPISVALNTRPKYVASTALTEPRWADTTVLSGDVAAACCATRARTGSPCRGRWPGKARRSPRPHGLARRAVLRWTPPNGNRSAKATTGPSRTVRPRRVVAGESVAFACFCEL